MKNYDPDPNIQQVFMKLYAKLPKCPWRHWLDITDIRDHEAITLQQSGLSQFENIYDQIRNSVSQHLPIVRGSEHNIAQIESNTVVLCHSSGTSTQNYASIKWYLLSRDLVTRLWAPGMQAIFESSGVTPSSHVAIFVPSRLYGDGLSIEAGQTVVRLYSSEFSQRLVLALLTPSRYLFDEYRNARSLPTLANLLSMKRIDVLSAPATTILGWADMKRLRYGVMSSLQSLSESSRNELANVLDVSLDLLQVARCEDLTQYLYDRLQEALTSATLIFGTSGMTENDWTLLHTFMNWSSDNATYTNLYVGSEIGPFAASLRYTISDPSHETMLVFPLTVSALQVDHRFQLLSRCPPGWRRLFTSQLQGDTCTLNIDTGDMIHLLPISGSPKILGKILRAGFPLKFLPDLPTPIQLPASYAIYVGDYFTLDTYSIIDPQALHACFMKHGLITKTASLVLVPNIEDKQDSWILYIPYPHTTKAIDDKALTCLKNTFISDLPHIPITLQFLSTNSIQPHISRQELVQRVRQGHAPKGVLKRWPLYVIRAENG